ncbi:MAG: 1-pyrroline-5-carboxylate dehydrogenase [Verrucomicrobiales bacterium]|nr:1-pyrroline-5-carboxylate dehydrogenase [Verrucomicrobiales bacterium]
MADTPETPDSSSHRTEAKAVELAEKLLVRSLEIRTSAERAEMERMADMVEDPPLKTVIIFTTDLLWRCKNAVRTAKGWRNILSLYGKQYQGRSFERLLLKLGGFGSRFLPWLVVPMVRKKLRQESERVIIPANDPEFSKYLNQRNRESIRLNINQLGEAVLGEDEAARRLNRTLDLLERPDVTYVSVKISAIFSQINIVAWDETLAHIKERLRKLYRAAGGSGKFVNLDMEEYRDLELTVTAFQEVLEEEEFLTLKAGIVLQAYLPDSYRIQQSLTAWATDRVKQGGAPIKVRIVKGANLAMEKVDAEWHGWKQAPFESKIETDASFKRMLEYGCRRENAEAVQLGIGSHNLFDVALAIVLMRENEVTDLVELEMLEGMADAQARAVVEEVGSILFYAPVVEENDFGSALAYLVRRLDENTAPGNFLTSLFSMKPGSPEWEAQKKNFLEAWERREGVSEEPNRATIPEFPSEGFHNQLDTDWTLPQNRERLTKALASCQKVDLPPVTTAEEVDSILKCAVNAVTGWSSQTVEGRAVILRQCAEQLSADRFDTIAVVQQEGKKAIQEADVEISEAIDFARYYAETGKLPEGVTATPLGVVVVTPPWNFPYAIPCGGVLAALMAGNAVILKPAPEAVETGWHLANQLWKAGVPRDVLQCILCEDHGAGEALIRDERTAAVILTGSWETAKLFRGWRPTMPLFAETSGKNAIVVSALADRELAVKDLVKSAFGHSGQKCSAASLGILEAEVYDDPVFLRQLKDAASSLAVGPATDLASIVTPLVQEPGEDLLRALTTLEEGEKWLLKPKVSPDDPCLWSPGIKLGVKPGSWFHQTECFGPVLGLIRAEDLDAAVRIQNDVPFGLTAGFQSLDEKEVAHWTEKVEAGNLYINRGITGAIVNRQPFGGWKKSSVGPGSKAGGPNYVNLFRRIEDVEMVRSQERFEEISDEYHDACWPSSDPSDLDCERNDFRYIGREGVIVRMSEADDFTISCLGFAAECSNVPLEISIRSNETAEDLIARLPDLAEPGVVFRTLGEELENDVLTEVARLEMNWIDAPLSVHGLVEIPRWAKEQVVCETLHRYGNPKPEWLF